MKESESQKKVALWISKIFHPLLLSSFLGYLLLVLEGLTYIQSLKWVALSTALSVVPLSLYIHLSSRYDSFENTEAGKRLPLLVIGIGEVALLLIILRLLEAPKVALDVLITGLIIFLVSGLIGKRYKLSIHTSVPVGFATWIAFLSIKWASVLYIISLGVAWSRLELGRHSIEEVVLGTITPAIIVSARFLVS